MKARKGELLALSETPDPRRDFISPLLEVPALPWDFENERPAKSIDGHLDPIPINIQKYWGTTHPLFVDLIWISDEETESGSHPVEKVMSDLRELGCQAIPVTGLSRSSAFSKAVANVTSEDGRGCCFRLEPDDLRRMNLLPQALESARENLGLDLGDIDLILDFKGFDSSQGAAIEIAAAAGLAALPQIDAWRSVTLAGGAFPLNLSGLGGETLIPRADWEVWRSVSTTRDEEGVRRPAFGDYAVQHPEPDEIDPRLMKMSASIRYTTPIDWLVLKGRNVQDYGWEQFYELAEQLVGHSEFRGPEFSSGDQLIEQCAKRETGTGNAMTWRKIGTNHHLAVVADQISSLP